MVAAGQANEVALSDPGHHHDKCECEAAGDEAPLDNSVRVLRSKQSFEHGAGLDRGI
jgi:hypothetical protein